MRSLRITVVLLQTLALAVMGQIVAPSNIAAADSVLKQLDNEIAAVAQNASPAVVEIVSSTYKTVKDPMNQLDQYFFGPRGRNFNRPESTEKQKQTGVGSGFIIDADGTILTNNHVVADADELLVKLPDGRQFDAKVLGTDPDTEVAAIKIEGADLPTVPLGDSDRMRPGNLVIAIGSPQGLEQTVTFGIVSAINRSNVQITEFSDFIQVDAAINLGNSGGPLLDVEGKVIGINTAIFSTSGGSQGIGFAIPINQARQIAESLKKNGKIVRGYLGIGLIELAPEMAEHLGTKNEKGVVVVQVVPDGPANGKLEVNDAIVGLNGDNLKDANDFRSIVAALPPGENVRLSVIRDGKKQTVRVELGERPPSDALSDPKTFRRGLEKEKSEELDLGFTVSPLTEPQAKQLGMEKAEGLLVEKVDVTSKAYGKGLRSGMVILQVNRQDVRTLDDLREALKAGKDKKSVMLLVATDEGDFLLFLPRED